MRGRILIAHSSKAVRAIVRRRTLTEAPDFLIDEAESADEAAARLKEGTFDIVICDEVLAGSAERGWIRESRELPEVRDLGYVFLISEATTEERRVELSAAGAHAFLDERCTGTDIATAIANVFDPRNQRQNCRASIPGTHARIHMGTIVVTADVVNFSVSGMLCDLPCPSQFGAIALPANVAIRFPAEFDPDLMDGIRAKVLRIHVVSSTVDHLPERIRAAWLFFHVPNDTYQRLNAVLGLTDEDTAPESRSLMG